MASNVPDGYHSITPYMTVDDADRLISFLIDALGRVVKESPWSSDTSVLVTTSMFGDASMRSMRYADMELLSVSPRIAIFPARPACRFARS